MILSGLSLKNFRTHKNTTLNFSETLNYIVGGNGQGKTSVLEAAYFLCTTKSFNSKDSEAVSFNESELEIRGSFNDLTEDKIRLVFSIPENRKYYFQNDKLISRSVQIIGKFPVVILTPADHAITRITRRKKKIC
jgi:DNA replication and repair protein RecF